MSPETARDHSGAKSHVAVLDGQVLAAMPLASVSDALTTSKLRHAQVLTTVMEGYAARPAIGQRRTELITDETGRRVRQLLPQYETVTYGELWARITALSSYWQSGSDPRVKAGDFVCTVGFVSADYVAVDLACVHAGAVAVPLQASGTVTQWVSIMSETTPRLLATSIELLQATVEAAISAATPEAILVFDYDPDDDRQREIFHAASVRIASLGLLVDLETLPQSVTSGQSLPPVSPYVPRDDEDPLAVLIYTSGSTGTPKGAMYTDRIASGKWLFGVGRPMPRITFNYLPLSHSAGRTLLLGTLAVGGTAYLAAASDMSTLFDDLALVRPTELFFVPRVCELLHQRFVSDVDRRLAEGQDRMSAENSVKTELREHVLGGRFHHANCGSAPLSAEMKKFIEWVLEVDFHDGYSSTETSGGVLIDNHIRRPPVIEYKLTDVPELGYFGTDKPHPRGELLLKTTTMFSGYFKRPDTTAEIFDDEGFYRTGDIMAELGPDHLVYLDRRNNVLKLSQGEFVTVATLEATFSSSPLVHQIFVYGSGERAYLLAVVVPTSHALTLPDTKAAVKESLREIARSAELNSYEIPREIILETEPFSLTNGLLSGAGKILRPKLKERYQEKLESLYIELSDEQASELLELRTNTIGRPVLDVVQRAIRAVLGHDVHDIRADAHFSDLGGDSLSALSLSNLLQEIFGIEVPVGVIVGPATDLSNLASYIETERRGAGRRLTAAIVHHGDNEITATELALDTFLDEATPVALPPATYPPKNILLTGANGYLGRFLCLEWLQRAAESGGTVICLIRGEDEKTAQRRLASAFDTGDTELMHRYRELAENRLRLVTGDLGEPYFGLGIQQWQQLAESVDLVVHAGALVNHMLPYSQLFGPNVVGTAEVIRLASTSTLKPVIYLSSVAVTARIAPSDLATESDIRAISPTRTLSGDYASGYGNSKWAGEVLLRNAHDLFGIPVAVFRSDMILAHTRYRGQLNIPDRFTRLLLSIVITGLAPASFYRIDRHGKPLRVHYDGLPVDFTAKAITALGLDKATGFNTFDVLNPHEDGPSLDEFVDWLIESGEEVTRIDSYAEWFTRFGTALQALPDSIRQKTMFPLLDSLRTPTGSAASSSFLAGHFNSAVRKNEMLSAAGIPQLNRELITKYVADMRLVGLL